MNCDNCDERTSRPYHPTEMITDEDGNPKRDVNGTIRYERNEDRGYCSIDCLEEDTYDKQRISPSDLVDSVEDLDDPASGDQPAARGGH